MSEQPALPEGTVTVLFTDMVDSTLTNQRLGDDAANRLRREIASIGRAALARHAGWEVKSTGDGQLCVFRSAREAVDCASDIRAGIAKWNRGAELPVRMRYGLHTGDVIVEANDIHGETVIIAQRLESIADPDQILVSEATFSVLGTARDDLEPLGERALKGIARSWRVYSLSRSELEADDAIFVGRGRELRLLQTFAAEAAAGSGHVVVVSGEAGIGKTTLVQRAIDGFKSPTLVVWSLLDHTVGTPAHWAWTQVLRDVAQAVGEEAVAGWAADLASLVPELSLSTDPSGPSGDAEFRTLDAIAQALRGVARSTALTIVIEDLQWADRPSSLAFLHLARQIQHDAIFLIGTFRDELGPRQTPFAQGMSELERLTHGSQLRLTALSHDEVTDFLERTVTDPESVDAEAFHHRTDGNPFFMVELARMIESGTEASGSLEQAVPVSVRDSLSSRVGALTPVCQEALAHASLLGREFGFAELAACVGGAESLVDAIEEATTAGLVEEAGAGRYRFVHALTQDSVRGGISQAASARMHGRIADAIRELSGRSDHDIAAQIAPHLIEAARSFSERRVDALAAAVAAGRGYRDLGAWDEASRMLREAVQLIEAGTPSNESLVDLHLDLSACYAFNNDPRHQEVSYHAFEIARDSGDLGGMARAVLSFNSPYSLQMDAESTRAIDETITSLQGNPALLARVLVHRWRYIDTPEATAATERAAAIAEELDLEAVRLALADHRSHMPLHHLQLDASAAAAREAFQIHADARDYNMAAHLLFDEATARYMRGEIDAAAEVASEGIDFSIRTNDRPYIEWGVAILAAVAILRGAFEDLSEILERVESPHHWIPYEHAWALDIRGEHADALSVLRPPAATDPEPNFARVEAVRARVFRHADDQLTANRHLARFARLFPKTIVPEWQRLHSLPELDDGQTAPAAQSQWRPWYDELVSWEQLRLGATVPTSLDRQRGLLALVLEDEADARAHLERAHEWCAEHDAPIEGARVDLALARLALQSHDETTAMDLIDRARPVFDRFDAKLYQLELSELAATIDPMASGPPSRLTPRELEVLRLLAAGMTNIEIADHLVVSPHTVANHVKSIRAKTGTENRTAAAAYAIRLGLDRNSSLN